MFFQEDSEQAATAGRAGGTVAFCFLWGAVHQAVLIPSNIEDLTRTNGDIMI